MTHLAILCVKNEGAFLLEWLAHHRACGFGHFLVFSNDCQDGTDEMLDQLAQNDWLTHLRNDGPYDKGGIQFTALKAAAKTAELKKADWILPLDIDEFVNIHTGDHTLAALHAAVPDATAITLTWRLFGTSGHIRYEDTPVLEAFTKCAPAVMHWPWRAAMFKTLYANDGTYRKPGVHRPRDPDHDRLAQANWVDGNGAALPEFFKTRRIFSDFGKNNFGLVQLNHYPLGSLETYLLKTDRGRAVHAADRLGMDYFTERNFNTETDTSISALAPQRAAILADLTSNKALAVLHEKAVRWRKERFATLLQEEPNRALFGRLLMTPPSQPIPPETARFLHRHAQRSHQNQAD